MQLDLREVEEICKTLYVQALKILPADIKAGFRELVRTETSATGRTILDTMIENIAVAERTKNILCQDTGIPIYNVVVGRDVEFDGAGLKRAIRTGCERATRDHSRRFRRTAGDGVGRDAPQGIGIGERLVPADAAAVRWHQRGQAFRDRPG